MINSISLRFNSLCVALFVCIAAIVASATNSQVALAHNGVVHDCPPTSATPQTGWRIFLPILTNDSSLTSGAGLPGSASIANSNASDTDDCDTKSHEQNDYDLAEAARKRSEPAFVADTQLQAQAAQAAKNVDGEWSAPKAWPFVFATAANLPDGRIIAWGGNNPTSFGGGTNTYAAMWNPTTNQFVNVNNDQHSMFCAIPTMLEDGRVFVDGGDGTRERTSTFDYRTNTWTRLQNMSTGRWYNGAVALPDGRVVTALGDPGGNYPEAWSAGNGWALLTGANLSSINNDPSYQKSWLPYLHLAPNGKVFHSGPTAQMNWMDLSGNGSLTPAGNGAPWYPKYSASIMYDQGKILVAGGAADRNPGSGASTNQAMTIDINGTTPVIKTIAPMAFARKFNTGVMLPTGEVMVIGGNTSGAEFSDNGSVLSSEIWNPDTQTWRTVANMSVPRNYHSVSLLMTDGRVFSGGGGLCACSADHPDHQIYSPPYLFNADGTAATRPAITAAPNVATYGSTITVQATSGITKFSLIKMSGTTHNLNSDLRYLRVPFTANGGSYQLTLSSNANVLTPGYWMLFAVNAQGVPSVAKVMQISNNSTGLTAVTPILSNTVPGDVVSVTVRAETKSGQALQFSASGLPLGLSINANTGLITGTVSPYANIGVASVVVTVTDGVNTIAVPISWQVSVFRNWVATQSSIDYGGDPTRAIDGKTEGTFANGSVTHTGIDANAWWQLDLSTSYSLTTITLWNRTDCCVDRLSNFYVFVSNADMTGRTFAGLTGDAAIWKYRVTGQAPATLVIPTNIIGRFVRVQLAGTNNLSLAEVQITGAPNIALGKPVTQSSTAFGGDAAKANDSKTDGVFSNGSVSHTDFETNAWWQVDLMNSYPLDSLRLFGRTDCCTDRLSNFYVFVSANNMTGRTFASLTGDASIWKYQVSGQMPAMLLIPAKTTGRYVRVQLAGNTALSLAEVEAFGQPVVGLTLNSLTTTPQPVNTTINYIASSSGGVNVRYKWLWGDGSPETAYTPSPNAAHAFGAAGLYTVRLTAIDNTNIERSLTFVQAVHLPQTTNRPTSSSNIAYETRSGANNRVWVVNQDNDTVSVFDAVTNAKVTEIGVGSKPRSIAIAPNGNVWVVNKGAASISVIAPGTLAVAQTIALPYASQPFGMAFSPAGGSAFVALEATGKLLKLDAANGTQTGSLDVGANVRGIAVSADGNTVLVSRFVTPKLPGEDTATVNTNGVGGEVVSVNAANMVINKTIVLQHSEKPDTENQGRGIPNYLGAVIISPDGGSAWVPSKQDNIKRGMLRDSQPLNFQNSVRAELSRIDLTNAGGIEDYPARIDHDNSSLSSAATFDRYGNYIFTALETSREVAVSDAYSKKEIWRFTVGRAPQGVLVSPDGLRLYVNNFMDRTVTVIDLSTFINTGSKAFPALATWNAVGTEKLSATVLNGKQLFYDARDPRLARESYMSCAACHNDGGQDGRVWDFTGFGEGLRNTIALNGRGGTAHGFLHWSGNFNEIQDFEGQIRNFAGGTGLMSDAAFNTGTRNTPQGDAKAGQSADLDALAAYLTSLNTFAPSPYRNADGTLTTDAQAGKTVFQSANCGQCHGGTAFSGSGANTLFNIGTIKSTSGLRLNAALAGIDPPTLRDVWATGPYLHDGSAATMSAAISAHTTVTQSAALNVTQIQQVVAYLQQIGNGEGSTQVTNLSQGKTATQSSVYGVGTPGRAVDGRTDGVWFNGSVTHTGFEANAWWQVDLGGSSTISNMVLWNRTDCCADRLKNFYVFVSSTDLTGRTYASIVADASVWKYQVTAQAPTSLSIPVNTSGRYVRVQLAGNTALSLAEVQVFGNQ